MNKKGLFFTMMAISLVVIFMIVFLFPTYSRLSEDMIKVSNRVNFINQFVNDVERDTQRGMYISAYRSMLAIESNILQSGRFCSNVSSQFSELFLNGSINGTTKIIMNASTFPDWTKNMGDKAKTVSLNLTISNGEISLLQEDPWNIIVRVEVEYQFVDLGNIANWSYNKVYDVVVPINGFEDPLYVINSYGRLTNVITPTPFDNNYVYFQSGNWNADNLLEHLNYSYYAHNPSAPSFLMRLENNTANSSYGIESFVNLQKVSEAGLVINSEASTIDYLYWTNTPGTYGTNLTPSWFRIDSNHLAKYNLTNISFVK